MKHIFLGVFLLFSITLFSQSEKNLGDFNEIKVYDRIEVELIKSDENKVVISGKNTEDVVFVIKNNILKIRMSLEEIFDGDETEVKVHYKNIDIIDANEGAFIGSNDVLEQFEISLRTQEGGTIRLQVKDLTFLNIKAISGGSIDVSGNSKNQNVDINTGGSYSGKKLLTETSEVVIRAAGEAHVNATKEVTAKVRAGGSVYIYGNPEKVDENTVFGGKIIRKN
jgi:uncharacterized pyridoxamine 5'-phosphate oxidase family protein